MRKLSYLVFAAVLICCSSKEETSTYLPIAEPTMEESIDPELPIDNNSENSDENDDEDTENTFPNGDSRILFVGNSLTYFNDLNELVEEETAKKGFNVTADILAKPNYAIIDHWADGEVQEMVRNADYDYLIIQQGPSSQAWGREVLFEYGEMFNTLCNSNGIELVYFMVWPSQSYYHTFPGVIQNYKEASQNTNSILCPVGEVWKNHFDNTGDFSYYGIDGFHPSLKGSTVAAEVIANVLYKKPKVDTIGRSGLLEEGN